MSFCEVVSVEEEWRTNTRRRQNPMGGKTRVSFGRVCLWLGLACGNFDQRLVALDRNGNYVAPKRIRCDQCT